MQSDLLSFYDYQTTFALEYPLRASAFRHIEPAMGQQHRVRVKRKRRLAYLERKKVSRRSARRETPKTKAKKQAASASQSQA